MGVSIILLCTRPAAGLAQAGRPHRQRRTPAVPAGAGQGVPAWLGLALGSIGFGTIATFITLYYASRGWANAALTLSLFGASFISARLLFGNLINRIGGFRVSPACRWRPWAADAVAGTQAPKWPWPGRH
jgi:hypothetical protein